MKNERTTTLAEAVSCNRNNAFKSIRTTVAEQALLDSNNDVIKQFVVVTPLAWADELSGSGDNVCSQAVLTWGERWNKQGFVPVVMGWPDGEYCYLVFRCNSVLPFVELDQEIVERAYLHANGVDGGRVMVVNRALTVKGAHKI